MACCAATTCQHRTRGVSVSRKMRARRGARCTHPWLVVALLLLLVVVGVGLLLGLDAMPACACTLVQARP